MIYTQIQDSYKYRHIANAVYAREMEYFHYDFDLKNFEHLVENIPPSAFRDDVEKRIVETKAQMENVLAIIAALKSQIDDEEAYAEAVSHTTRQREEKERSE